MKFRLAETSSRHAANWWTSMTVEILLSYPYLLLWMSPTLGSYHVLPYFFGASTTFLVKCFYFLTVICSHQFYAPIILLLSVLKLILNHQESRPLEKHNMFKFRALLGETCQHKNGKQQTYFKCTAQYV
jgi:hypothetical protein